MIQRHLVRWPFGPPAGNCRRYVLCFANAACLLTILLGSTRALAKDNPFGLPTAQDENRPGSVMLHGGGQGVNDEVQREFVRLAGGKDARILLMPSDMSQRGKNTDGEDLPESETIAAYERRLADPKWYGTWAAYGASGQVADFQFLYRDSENDPDDARFFDALKKATGVWLPAYDQEWLPSLFAAEYPQRTSRFQLALREVVARGGVVGGNGGGMSSLPETVIAGDAPGDSGWMRAKLRFGLALFSGAVVDQNFEAHAGRLERLTDLLRNGVTLDRLAGKPGVERRTIGLGVEQQTVLILCGNTIRALGKGRGHIFLKSNGDRTITWQTLSAGEDPLVVQSSAARPARRGESDFPHDGDDFNPFGVPEPDDSTNWGTVVLHGGGDTDEITDLLPKLSGAAKPRMVHCPAAREKCRPSAEIDRRKLAAELELEFVEWRRLQTDGRLEDLSFVTTSSPLDANRPEFVRPLQHANAMWFCGGDQTPLAELFIDRLRPTLFQQEALNILRRGGVVGGSSAGLAIMADVMIEGGDPEDGRPAAADLSRGLGTMKHVLAEQHFDARTGRIERLTGLLRDHKRLANFSPTSRPKQMIGLAVEEDTALIAQRNHLRVTGKKLAHVFLQAADPRVVTWHALKPGDAAIVLQGRDRYVLELEDWEFGE